MHEQGVFCFSLHHTSTHPDARRGTRKKGGSDARVARGGWIFVAYRQTFPFCPSAPRLRQLFALDCDRVMLRFQGLLCLVPSLQIIRNSENHRHPACHQAQSAQRCSCVFSGCPALPCPALLHKPALRRLSEAAAMLGRREGGGRRKDSALFFVDEGGGGGGKETEGPTVGQTVEREDVPKSTNRRTTWPTIRALTCTLSLYPHRPRCGVSEEGGGGKAGRARSQHGRGEKLAHTCACLV